LKDVPIRSPSLPGETGKRRRKKKRADHFVGIEISKESHTKNGVGLNREEKKKTELDQRRRRGGRSKKEGLRNLKGGIRDY